MGTAPWFAVPEIRRRRYSDRSAPRSKCRRPWLLQDVEVIESAEAGARRSTTTSRRSRRTAWWSCPRNASTAAANPDVNADHLSAGRALASRDGASGKRLPTLTIDTQIGFRSAADRAAFADDLTAAHLLSEESVTTTANVPYRLEFSVEVPGTAEQVWEAVATAKGMSAWFLH